ncbi:hypothetical protein Nepgr_022828 [Nepenthes gracilis]|uniref:Haloacid dehalogenase-like hydrolase domain-containing protein n=1 Tax=Nepenthes gracilis TaxID=150966 RepID=A0AAD3XYS8_NEPGR|nr:hypothetical protein Nepgr_022828 [Nepenthes gracilis]
MDATAYSFLCNLGYSSLILKANTNKLSPNNQKANRYCVSTSPSKFKICPRIRNSVPFIASSSHPASPEHGQSEELAILLEVDGVLMDAYHSGNRQAFNVAFQKLGLDCAKWTEPIYSDLFRKGVGDEERMLVMYFNRIGWPTSLPTSEKEAFMRRILVEKEQALGDFVMSKSVPLRPGVEKFIDDACSEGIPVVVLTTSSELGEEIARASVEKLGHERISKIKIVGNEEVQKSLYSQFVLGQASFSGLGEELANEANEAVASDKKRVAEEVASLLKLRVDINAGSAKSMQKTVAALRAGAEHTGVPVHNCVLITGNYSGVAAADIIGLCCIVLRSSLTSRAEFPSAKAVMDGFGDVDLTISNLRRKLCS